MAMAAPAGGRVVLGSVSITFDPPVVRVQQQTEYAVILWDSFNLAPGERVEIIQPSQQARLVNRVSRRGLSNIEGMLRSNGQVLILNADGVVHASSAESLVGGLVLSGLDLRTPEVAGAAIRLLNENTGRPGVVENSGTIAVARGGNLALIGKRVENHGLLKGEHASAALAAGRGVTLGFDASGLINLNVTEELIALPDGSDIQLRNTGEIAALSGRILLTASKSPRLFKPLRDGILATDSQITLAPAAGFAFGAGGKLQNSGALRVNLGNVVDHGGHIVLIADTIENTGSLEAATSGWDFFDTDINTGSTETRTPSQIVIAAAKRVDFSFPSYVTISSVSESQVGTIRVFGKTIALGGSVRAHSGGVVRIGEKGTQTVDQLADTLTSKVDADIEGWGYLEDSPTKVRIWAHDAVDVSGYIIANEAEMISAGKMNFNSYVTLYKSGDSSDIPAPAPLVIQAKDILATFGEVPWSVNLGRLPVDSENVTLKADQDLIVLGSASARVLRGSQGSLNLEAGNDLTLENILIYKNPSSKLQAGNDLLIAGLTVIGSSDCQFTALRDIYLSNSSFIKACVPEDFRAGGKLETSNVQFVNY